MTASPAPIAVRCSEHSLWADLDDGRSLGVPFAGFPRLLHATPQQREAARISAAGLHWEEIDEDISIAGSLADKGDTTRARKHAA
jgi:hypothetical protein